MKTYRERAAQPHRYRVTVEHLYTPHTGDALDPPLVFETSNQEALMLLFIVNRLGQRNDIAADPVVFDTSPAQCNSTRPM
jgi:hypothetical protein